MPEPTPAERRALFAQEFQGTTNLDQRRRFAQELSEAKARSEERDQALFEQEQRKNPKLMQAVTGRARERRMTIEGMDRADLAERKFTWDQEKAVLSRGLQERSIALREKQERRLFDKAQQDLIDAEKMEDDTAAVERAEWELRERGIMPGSKGYQDAITNIFARSPYLDPAFRKVLAEGAKINLDADELQAELANLQEKFPGASFTIGTDGRPTIRQAPVRPTPQAKIDLARLDKLTKEEAELSNQKERTPAQIKRLGYLQGEIQAIDKQRQAVADKAAPAAQPSPSVPADGMATNLAPGTTGQPQSSPAAEKPAVIWKMDKAGNKFEYDAKTQKWTGQYIKAK